MSRVEKCTHRYVCTSTSLSIWTASSCLLFSVNPCSLSSIDQRTLSYKSLSFLLVYSMATTVLHLDLRVDMVIFALCCSMYFLSLPGDCLFWHSIEDKQRMRIKVLYSFEEEKEEAKFNRLECSILILCIVKIFVPALSRSIR